MIVDIGIVRTNLFGKVSDVFATFPKAARVSVGMKVPESWIESSEDGSGYVITICQFFDQVLNLHVIGKVSVTRNDDLFRVSEYERSDHTNVNLEFVNRDYSWKVIVKTRIGRAEFMENATIFGYFDRRNDLEVSNIGPETHRNRIFKSILDKLNKTFSNVNSLAHQEFISVTHDSPTVGELIKFLEENGYHSSCTFRGELIVYL